MSFAKVPPDVVAAFEAALPIDVRVERRKMFGCPCAFVHNNLFFGCVEDRLTVRLPHDLRVVALSTIPGARAFSPMGRPMREYVELPGDTPSRALYEWAHRSFAWAAALPVKPAKAKKTSVKPAKPPKAG